MVCSISVLSPLELLVSVEDGSGDAEPHAMTTRQPANHESELASWHPSFPSPIHRCIESSHRIRRLFITALASCLDSYDVVQI